MEGTDLQSYFRPEASCELAALEYEKKGLWLDVATTFGKLSALPSILYFSALAMASRAMLAPYTRQQKPLVRMLTQDSETQGVADALLAFDRWLILVKVQKERAIDLKEYHDRGRGILQTGEVVNSFYLLSSSRSNSVCQSLEYIRSG